MLEDLSTPIKVRTVLFLIRYLPYCIEYAIGTPMLELTTGTYWPSD